MSAGTVFGVGLGPGSPGLITLDAVRAIEQSDIVVYPLIEDGSSKARDIAARFISATQHELPLRLTMSRNRDRSVENYQKTAGLLAAETRRGARIAVLCLGDPLFFGSFIHLQAALPKQVDVQIIPGISVLQGFCARSRIAAASLSQNLAVVSGDQDDQFILQSLSLFDNIFLLKVNKHLPRLLKLIEQANRRDQCIFAQHLYHHDELIIDQWEQIKDLQPGYFSVLVITKNKL